MKKRSTRRKASIRRALNTAQRPEPSTRYEPSYNSKFVQIVCDGHTLYGLDDKGRVFAYVDAGWLQVEGDEIKMTLKAVDLNALGEKLASAIPDDQRHGKTLEKQREASQRRYEIYREVHEVIAPLDRQVTSIAKMLYDVQQRLNQIHVPVKTANGAEEPKSPL